MVALMQLPWGLSLPLDRCAFSLAHDGIVSSPRRVRRRWDRSLAFRAVPYRNGPRARVVRGDRLRARGVDHYSHCGTVGAQ
jgi:hypothetical protein